MTHFLKKCGAHFIFGTYAIQSQVWKCSIRDGPLFFPRRGIVIGKKIVCMRKNAEINCQPQRCIWKKLSAETTYVMQDLENFLKIVCTAGVEEKNLQALNRWWRKISCLPVITILPSGEK